MRILLVLAMFFATGCFHINYVTDKPRAPSPEYKKWHNDFVYGLAEGSDPVDVKQICPEGVARIESEETFVNGLVNVLTIGIYNPQEVTVTCVASSK